MIWLVQVAVASDPIRATSISHRWVIAWQWSSWMMWVPFHPATNWAILSTWTQSQPSKIWCDRSCHKPNYGRPFKRPIAIWRRATKALRCRLVHNERRWQWRSTGHNGKNSDGSGSGKNFLYLKISHNIFYLFLLFVFFLFQRSKSKKKKKIIFRAFWLYVVGVVVVRFISNSECSMCVCVWFLFLCTCVAFCKRIFANMYIVQYMIWLHEPKTKNKKNKLNKRNDERCVYTDAVSVILIIPIW